MEKLPRRGDRASQRGPTISWSAPRATDKWTTIQPTPEIFFFEGRRATRAMPALLKLYSYSFPISLDRDRAARGDLNLQGCAEMSGSSDRAGGDVSSPRGPTTGVKWSKDNAENS